MIFTTQCPSCEATYPIDSAKVPDGGVYARCSDCGGVFLVEVPAAEAAEETYAAESSADPVSAIDHPPASEEAAASATASDEPASDGPTSDESTDELLADEPPAAEPVAEEAAEVAPEEPVAEPAPVEAQAVDWTGETTAEDTELAIDAAPAHDALEATAPAAAATKAPPVFGKRDPHERAQRLARVLVSDMIAYHPDRHRRSLEEGTLKGDFEEEIDKSWNEYVDQVGQELADSTAYFTDALNEILAKGESVF